MNITVLGLWHLGCVTAACCAERFAGVRGLDFDDALIADLSRGKPPISEPGLAELLQAGLQRGALSFSQDAATVCRDTDVLWVCFDTPVDEQDRADVGYVHERLERCVPHLKSGALVVCSSQMPVGTCREWGRRFPQFRFAVIPENLQLGRALDAFRKAERMVIGVREPESRTQLEALCRPFAANLLFMSPESAEMTKHALNSFLAVSIVFANEVARLCERVGADAREVEQGLKSDIRIGPRAYLKPGPAFAGGTLARDVAQLTRLGQELGEPLQLIPAIRESNEQHKQWAVARLQHVLGSLEGKTITLLGLTYKPGTDTLRRSSAIELARQILAAGGAVRAFDPAVKILPAGMPEIRLAATAEEAVAGTDAAVLCTPWPEFKAVNWSAALVKMRRPMVLDAVAFVAGELKNVAGVEYYTIGKGA